MKMAISKGKTRLQVSMSIEMSNKVKFYADKMGITTSALVSQMVGQQIMAYDKAYGLADEFAERLFTLEKEKREREEEKEQVKGQLSIGNVE
jgi:mannitol-specific phosphotransferase system IIBC component